VTFVAVFTLTRKVSPLRARFVGLRPIPRCARDQHYVLSCALRAGPAQAGAWLCVGLGPIPRFARDQHCVLSCALRAGRSSLQGTTLRRRRFAPDTCLIRPSDAFN
jgi:hypothetical protein